MRISRETESLGVRRRVYKRRSDVSAIIVHTTGVGVIKRWLKQGAQFNETKPLQTAVRIYRAMMTAGPHYVVGQCGEIVKVCPHELAAHHVGSKGGWKYWKPWKKKAYAWWFETFPGLSSPRKLAGGKLWKGGSCNMNTIGIEVVPPIGGIKKPWSQDCWESLAWLLKKIAEEESIPLDRQHVLSHSEAHPIGRTTKSGKPWDPNPHQWSWETCAAYLAPEPSSAPADEPAPEIPQVGPQSVAPSNPSVVERLFALVRALFQKGS